MEAFVKGTTEDAQDIIDFADLVFSKNSGPLDFAGLIPKLYGDGADTQQYHYMVKENGKIKAMVCVLPVTCNVAGIELKVGCVGTVSVHPRSRGKGYMQKLMNMAVEDMKSQGCSLSVLGGQRQRYEFFGYEPAGIKFEFTLTSDNIRHKYKGLDSSGINFEPLFSDSPQLDDAYQLYQQGIVNGARTKEQFATILRTWQTQPLVILENGKFAGYVALSKDGGAVREIEMIDPALLPVVSKALAAEKNLDELHFTVPPYDPGKIALLGDVCDWYRTSYEYNYHIMDYSSVIEAFLRCKAQNMMLQDGRIVLGIEDSDIVEIVVQNNQVVVNKYDPDHSDIQAQVSLTKREATALLFSPLSEFTNWKLAERQLNLPSGWLPLPLYIPSLDIC
ncbi:GNAT family N-acetyltransferase [Paenibacillus motobuensis]|uniref:GNAT family N-acetyltransferase n=1 Tax=Paenibacillus TaxID=44249 RepID=UPI00203D533E|nr:MULTISPECIES: GNAT family N-acetyltransferase [Paenibacillus]MCM3042277.1 GNAT family N-acetyltransferase [Paenibacillus lutimineralis]MCM3649381.1 GNAT family N-acetyltransferase [Paenibacillus motobuensis]